MKPRIILIAMAALVILCFAAPLSTSSDNLPPDFVAPPSNDTNSLPYLKPDPFTLPVSRTLTLSLSLRPAPNPLWFRELFSSRTVARRYPRPIPVDLYDWAYRRALYHTSGKEYREWILDRPSFHHPPR